MPSDAQTQQALVCIGIFQRGEFGVERDGVIGPQSCRRYLEDSCYIIPYSLRTGGAYNEDSPLLQRAGQLSEQTYSRVYFHS